MWICFLFLLASTNVFIWCFRCQRSLAKFGGNLSPILDSKLQNQDTKRPKLEAKVCVIYIFMDLNLLILEIFKLIVTVVRCLELTPTKDRNSLFQRNRISELQKDLKDTGNHNLCCLSIRQCFGFVINMFSVRVSGLRLTQKPSRMRNQGLVHPKEMLQTIMYYLFTLFVFQSCYYILRSCS